MVRRTCLERLKDTFLGESYLGSLGADFAPLHILV